MLTGSSPPLGASLTNKRGDALCGSFHSSASAPFLEPYCWLLTKCREREPPEQSGGFFMSRIVPPVFSNVGAIRVRENPPPGWLASEAGDFRISFP